MAGGGRGRGVVSACGTFWEGFEINGLGLCGKWVLRIGGVAHNNFAQQPGCATNHVTALEWIILLYFLKEPLINGFGFAEMAV